MKAVPTWFGEPERPLFGWFHAPDGDRAKGAAVFCGPLGVEGPNSLWAVQAASDQLAAEGVAVLRFAYSGTGDSAERSTIPTAWAVGCRTSTRPCSWSEGPRRVRWC